MSKALVVYKYQLVIGHNILHIHKGGKPVSVIDQVAGVNHQIVLYMEYRRDFYEIVNLAFTKPTEELEVLVVGTGTIDQNTEEFTNFVGTVQQGPYVWHVYTKASDTSSNNNLSK